jgi:small GTP-binding protein
MSLSVGIVGLPNSGKSTLFNALLSRQIAQVANYPFTTIEPNVGIVPVPDERLNKLSELIKPQVTTPASVEFIDIAGLIKGAHQGEGLGNQFLAKIREVSLIVHIVRVFTNPDVVHYYETIDPARDIEIVNLELELGEIRKPTLYVANVDEKQLGSEAASQLVSQTASRLGPAPSGAGLNSKSAGQLDSWQAVKLSGGQAVELIPICAKTEAELADFSEEEKKAYLKELGIMESGLDKLIKKAYEMLGLITFYTIKGGKEVRAWSLLKGKTALEAAEEVHTDMAKGFIKAEVISYQDLMDAGLSTEASAKAEGWQKAGELGKIRLEGHDYQIQDGDVIEFKFSA